jgi:hypothetical protein
MQDLGQSRLGWKNKQKKASDSVSFTGLVAALDIVPVDLDITGRERCVLTLMMAMVVP